MICLKKYYSTLRLCAVLLITLFLSSCMYSEACWNNLKGVFSFEKGRYGDALVSYAKASGRNISNSEYVYYNISRVYSDMGENSSAAGILDSLSRVDDKKLEYRISSLKAVMAHNEGRYDDAVLFYKNSIKIDNSDINLIKGLELAFKQLENSRRGRNKKPDRSESIEAEHNIQSRIRHGSSDIIDLIFTEEVELCPGNRITDQTDLPDW